ncbi:MAG TPA: hypothetical protein VF950_20850 [Planctomycetota bacterium]
MILRDFDLNAPELPRMKASAFRYQIRCVMNLFRRLCRGVRTEDFWRIWVECVTHVRHTPTVSGGGVLHVQIRTEPLDDFTRLPEPAKKARALGFLMRGIKAVAKARRLPLAPFLKAKDEVIARGYENTWERTKQRPKGRLKGVLTCRMNCRRFEATLSIRSKAGDLLARSIVLRTKPDELHFGYSIKKLAWRGNVLELLDWRSRPVAALSLPAD